MRHLGTIGLVLAFLLAEVTALRYYGNLFLAHFSAPVFATPPDFLCYWTNGAIARGQLPASAGADVGPFLYPPSFLLVAAPLSLLSQKTAYLVWLGGTNLAAAAAARWVGMSPRAIVLSLLSPPNLYCIATGQTGALLAASQLLAFGLAERRPIVAGLSASLLIIKPQFMLLAPICFLVSGNFRALAAFLTGILLWCLLPALFFGPDLWPHFLHAEPAISRVVMDRPWPEPYEGVLISWFIMLRSLGAGLSLAYTGQFLVSLVAACGTAMLWFKHRAPNSARLTTTLCLTALAAPYGYLYDIPALAMSLANDMERDQRTALACAIFWLISGFYLFISMTSFVSGALFLSLLAGYFYQMARPENMRLIPVNLPRSKP